MTDSKRSGNSFLRSKLRESNPQRLKDDRNGSVFLSKVQCSTFKVDEADFFFELGTRNFDFSVRVTFPLLRMVNGGAKNELPVHFGGFSSGDSARSICQAGAGEVS